MSSKFIVAIVTVVAVFMGGCATSKPSRSVKVETPSFCEMELDPRSHELLARAVDGRNQLDGLYCGTWGGGKSPTYLIVYVREDGAISYFYEVSIGGTLPIHAEGKATKEDEGFSFNARGARVYMKPLSTGQLAGDISTYGGYSSAVLTKVNKAHLDISKL